MRIRQAADATDAQVTVLRLAARLEPASAIRASTPWTTARHRRWSRSTSSSPTRSLIRRRMQGGQGTFRDGDEVGMVALAPDHHRQAPRVAFYSRDFDDVRETVAFVRDRVLLASAARRS